MSQLFKRTMRRIAKRTDSTFRRGQWCAPRLRHPDSALSTGPQLTPWNSLAGSPWSGSARCSSAAET